MMRAHVLPFIEKWKPTLKAALATQDNFPSLIGGRPFTGIEQGMINMLNVAKQHAEVSLDTLKDLYHTPHKEIDRYKVLASSDPPTFIKNKIFPITNDADGLIEDYVDRVAALENKLAATAVAPSTTSSVATPTTTAPPAAITATPPPAAAPPKASPTFTSLLASPKTPHQPTFFKKSPSPPMDIKHQRREVEDEIRKIAAATETTWRPRLAAANHEFDETLKKHHVNVNSRLDTMSANDEANEGFGLLNELSNDKSNPARRRTDYNVSKIPLEKMVETYNIQCDKLVERIQKIIHVLATTANKIAATTTTTTGGTSSPETLKKQQTQKLLAEIKEALSEVHALKRAYNNTATELDAEFQKMPDSTIKRKLGFEITDLNLKGSETAMNISNDLTKMETALTSGHLTTDLNSYQTYLDSKRESIGVEMWELGLKRKKILDDIMANLGPAPIPKFSDAEMLKMNTETLDEVQKHLRPIKKAHTEIARSVGFIERMVPQLEKIYPTSPNSAQLRHTRIQLTPIVHELNSAYDDSLKLLRKQNGDIDRVNLEHGKDAVVKAYKDTLDQIDEIIDKHTPLITRYTPIAENIDTVYALWQKYYNAYTNLEGYQREYNDATTHADRLKRILNEAVPRNMKELTESYDELKKLGFDLPKMEWKASTKRFVKAKTSGHYGSSGTFDSASRWGKHHPQGTPGPYVPLSRWGKHHHQGTAVQHTHTTMAHPPPTPPILGGTAVHPALSALVGNLGIPLNRNAGITGNKYYKYAQGIGTNLGLNRSTYIEPIEEKKPSWHIAAEKEKQKKREALWKFPTYTPTAEWTPLGENAPLTGWMSEAEQRLVNRAWDHLRSNHKLDTSEVFADLRKAPHAMNTAGSYDNLDEQVHSAAVYASHALSHHPRDLIPKMAHALHHIAREHRLAPRFSQLKDRIKNKLAEFSKAGDIDSSQDKSNSVAKIIANDIDIDASRTPEASTSGRYKLRQKILPHIYHHIRQHAKAGGFFSDLFGTIKSLGRGFKKSNKLNSMSQEERDRRFFMPINQSGASFGSRGQFGKTREFSMPSGWDMNPNSDDTLKSIKTALKAQGAEMTPEIESAIRERISDAKSEKRKERETGNKRIEPLVYSYEKTKIEQMIKEKGKEATEKQLQHDLKHAKNDTQRKRILRLLIEIQKASEPTSRKRSTSRKKPKKSRSRSASETSVSSKGSWTKKVHTKKGALLGWRAKLPTEERRKHLADALKSTDYKTMVRRLNFLVTVNKKKQPEISKIAHADMEWLQKNHKEPTGVLKEPPKDGIRTRSRSRIKLRIPSKDKRSRSTSVSDHSKKRRMRSNTPAPPYILPRGQQ